MQELVGRLSALDAEATENLKVIAYFDALIAGHASPEVHLRGAAVLGGCPAGFTLGAQTLRIDADGSRISEVVEFDDTWPTRSLGGDGQVWLERSGTPHANDQMILERVSIALSISVDRTSSSVASRQSIETLIDPASSPQDRLDATHRMRLRPVGRYMVVAAPQSSAYSSSTTIVTTSCGPVRVAILEQDAAVSVARAGIGVVETPDGLSRSWTTALIALRLTSSREPVVRASDLGSLLLLAEAAEVSSHDNPDVVALAELSSAHPRSLDLLESLVVHESVRAVAKEAGMHHSTVQAKFSDYAGALGYDVRSSPGRVRLALALALHRLESAQFS